MYPVMLQIEKKPCLVVGGGGVALRKIEGLLAERAVVTVIAREPIDAVSRMAQDDILTLKRRPYQTGEASGFSLVVAATDDRAINRLVSLEAQAAGVWVNVADDPELCTFFLPARVQRGAFQLAVASLGEAPFVVRRLRRFLERRFGEEWAEWMSAAGRFRKEVRTRALARERQERLYDRFFDATVDSERIRARVPTAAEEAAWFSEIDTSAGAAADIRHDTISSESVLSATGAAPGFVSLVGAGPGDPGLLTLRGRQRLLAADAVVFDRLAASSLPGDLHARIELHPVGKAAGFHPMPQEEINALLIRLARAGHRVVRFKGGDPFVFGRGGEEAEALANAKVPFEVVPCVTAGIAVPAYAGIPVTHRQDATRLTLVTAHESAKKNGPQARWDLMAQDQHATVVGYMGVSNLPNVVTQLLQGGMNPSTPAAMIERGTTSAQRVARATLSQLPQAVVDVGISPPALFVIGSAARHAQALDWFSMRPLSGERLGMIAPRREVADALDLAGAEIVEMSLPITPAARVLLGALPMTGWIFHNAEEVEALEDERDGPGFAADAIAWCLNADAAERARTRSWAEVHAMTSVVTAADLVGYISQQRRHVAS